MRGAQQHARDAERLSSAHCGSSEQRRCDLHAQLRQKMPSWCIAGSPHGAFSCLISVLLRSRERPCRRDQQSSGRSIVLASISLINAQKHTAGVRLLVDRRLVAVPRTLSVLCVSRTLLSEILPDPSLVRYVDVLPPQILSPLQLVPAPAPTRRLPIQPQAAQTAG
jgi:hypothetical protein